MNPLSKLRIRLIQEMIAINEKYFFYPAIRKFYKEKIDTENPLILDIGSNKGQSIKFFKSLFPNSRIIGFEPNRKLYRNLKKSYPEIEIHNLGISEEVGQLKFQENIMNETSTFEKINFRSDYVKKKVRILGIGINQMIVDSYYVDVVSLHHFLSMAQIEKIDIIKIDVEGHELKCLKGLFKGQNYAQIDLIQLESHNDGMYENNKAEISNILLDNEFKLVKRIKHGFGDFEELIYQNIIS